MRRSVTTIVLAGLVGGLSLIGSEAAAQTSVAGTYTLMQVDNQDLPVVTERDGDCHEEVLAATLMLSESGDWRLEYTERETCGSRVDEDLERESGDYTINGNALRFPDDTDPYDPDNIDIDDLGTGTISGGELTVTLEDGRTVLTFRRQ